MSGASLAGWVPIGVYWQDDAPFVDWVQLGEARFEEPFFHDTIQRCLGRPFNLLFRRQTPIDALGDWQAARPGLPPSGFIFHMSRCGSTLVAQLLAALPQHVVLSEAGPVDAVLRLRPDASAGAPVITEAQRIAWLQGMVSALGQRRSGAEERLFLKFDSWSTLSLPLIERAFPGVPWIFVYRDPVAVIASQMKQRGVQMVPALVEPALFGMDVMTAVTMAPEEYCGRVLAAICAGALRRLRDGAGMAVNYAALPDAVWSSLSACWGLPLTADDRARMIRASRVDAKQPALAFNDDTAAKQRSVPALAREMADRFVRPLYDELDALSNQIRARAVAD